MLYDRLLETYRDVKDFTEKNKWNELVLNRNDKRVGVIAAMKQNYHIKQSEVHGMAQRGGAVRSQLRISEKVIYSDLIRLKTADMIIAVEPMKALHCRNYLGDNGIMVAIL